MSDSLPVTHYDDELPVQKVHEPFEPCFEAHEQDITQKMKYQEALAAQSRRLSDRNPCGNEPRGKCFKLQNQPTRERRPAPTARNTHQQPQKSSIYMG